MAVTAFIRPLNSVVVRFMSDVGPRYFLIDTGMPFNVAKQANKLSSEYNRKDDIQVWPLVNDLRFQHFDGINASLNLFSERLGVPIEGIIGASALIQTERMEIDWAHREIIFGAGERAPELSAANAERLTLNRSHHFFSIPVSLDGRTLDAFIDTGARFLSVHSLNRAPGTPLYELAVHTAQGPMIHRLSAGHRLSYGGRLENICVATGIPPMAPNTLGTELLARHPLFFNFKENTLTIGSPYTTARTAWEALSGDLCAPAFLINLDPAQMNEPDRPFKAQALPGRPLPEGVHPNTPYRLRGFRVPAGPEGVNALYEALYAPAGTPEAEDALILVGPSGEQAVKRTRVFV